MGEGKLVLGIVGGMGSYATVDFFKRVVDAFPAEYEWDRPRILIDNNCVMPSRVRAILYNERRAELASMLAESTKNLMAAGATHIVYACNTSHVFIPEVLEILPEAEGKLLHIIDLCGQQVKDAGAESAYLLATEGTIQTGIYQDRFEPFGIEIEAADAEEQKLLREFIETVKQNKIDEAAAARFCDYLNTRGRKHIILGCTELPVLFGHVKGLDPSIHIYDPVQAAIDLVVKLYNQDEA